jgi:hypothetical protein
MSRVKRVEPIKPKDILDNLEDVIHPAVVQAVNELLKEQFRGGSCTIKQKDIESRAKKISGVTSTEIYDKKWMDFEPIFRKAGWKVSYNSPDRDEDFDSYFSFSAK